MATINFILNGKRVSIQADTEETLLDILKKIHITSVKRGCEEGVCGTCTVLFNDRPVLSCLIPAHKVEGQSITTLEGIDDELMRIIKEEFTRNFAFQCGYCTSGFLLTIYAYLKKLINGGITYDINNLRLEIAKALKNNLCRCGAYKEIEKATISAAIRIKIVKS